jgi:3'-5' exoribonuclease
VLLSYTLKSQSRYWGNRLESRFRLWSFFPACLVQTKKQKEIISPLPKIGSKLGFGRGNKLSRAWVNELKEGQQVAEFYALKDKRLMPFKQKDGNFLMAVLSDRTGDVRAVMWEGADKLEDTIEVGRVVYVVGRVESFRGEPQLVLTSIQRTLDENIDAMVFLPSTTQDRQEMVERLKAIIGSIAQPHLSALLNQGLLENDGLLERFTLAPAAKSMHQAYIGGLLEHTLNVAALCQAAVRLYPSVDRDLLVAGAILHDLGKVEEYTWTTVVDLSDPGKLLGHIVIGGKMVDNMIQAIEGFPAELGLRLQHMIVSHHGELEWGSPKQPQTLEACILHFADNMDAQCSRFQQILFDESEDQWTSYDQRLGRQLFVGEAKGSRLVGGTG